MIIKTMGKGTVSLSKLLLGTCGQNLSQARLPGHYTLHHIDRYLSHVFRPLRRSSPRNNIHNLDLGSRMWNVLGCSGSACGWGQGGVLAVSKKDGKASFHLSTFSQWKNPAYR